MSDVTFDMEHNACRYINATRSLGVTLVETGENTMTGGD
jgi:hypothetical protein